MQISLAHQKQIAPGSPTSRKLTNQEGLLSGLLPDGRPPAHRYIRVLTRGPRPLSPPSADTLGNTAHRLDQLFRCLLIDLLRPKPPFKSHSAPRPPQTPQRLPPLLIENASDRVPLRCESVLPEAFPIKPSDHPFAISYLTSQKSVDSLCL
jgi:hypothetical protein